MRFRLFLIAPMLAACAEQPTQRSAAASERDQAGQGAGEIGGPSVVGEKMVRYECADGTRFVARFPQNQPYMLLERAGREPLPMPAVPTASEGFAYARAPYALQGTVAFARYTAGTSGVTVCRGQPATPPP